MKYERGKTKTGTEEMSQTEERGAAGASAAQRYQGCPRGAESG